MAESSKPEGWLRRWHEVRPDVDPLCIAVNGRLIRLTSAFSRRREAVLASLGLTQETSDLIISLLRAGHDGLNAGDLRVEATFPIDSSSAMTYRIDRAEALGLVERRRDPKDRRGVIISLTPRGRELAHRDVDLNVEFVRELLGTFTQEEREALGDLLKRLLAALTDEEFPPIAVGVSEPQTKTT
jgi:DNA-binding MarR family transcriptional regulator